MKTLWLLPASLLIMVAAATHVSALMVTDVQAPTLAPGQEGEIVLDLENKGSRVIEDISVSLDLANLPFIPVGGSEASVEKLNEDREKTLRFTIRASPDAKPGDYKIPYSISAKNVTQKSGMLGVRVTGTSRISFNTQIDTPVVGQRGKVTLRIVNSGLTDARFVSLRVLPDGLTLLSEEKMYVGTINSDDFESVSFDALFLKEKPRLTLLLTYTDFDNREQTLTEDLPLTVYTQEKALELGIIQKNNTFWYVLGVVVLFILWMIWRSYKKRQRMKRSKELVLGR